MALAAYNVKKVNFIINSPTLGQHYLTGFFDKSTIDVTYASDAFTKHRGLKGDMHYAETNDDGGTAKVKLMHDSPSNKWLYKLFKLKEPFAINVVDGNDSSKSSASGINCIILKPADFSRGSEMVAQEWTFDIPNLDIDYDQN